MGETIYSYTALLTVKKWDAVWVVGGELGGISTKLAIHYSLDEDFYELRGALEQPERERLQALLGAPPIPSSLAYIPQMAEFALNRGTPLIVNSAGGFGSRPNDDLLITALGAAQISVRDPSSQAHLKTLGITSRLAPDMVHDLSSEYPIRPPENPTYLIFQQNGALLSRPGVIESTAEQLVRLSRTSYLDIVLLAAGTARGHDDLEIYGELVAAIKSFDVNVRVSVHSERSPLAIVSSIANSALWIGSSLHGRIVAASYGRPRVSLSTEKVDGYCAKWDPDFPFGAGVEEIAVDGSRALDLAHPNLTNDNGCLARNNLSEMIQELGEMLREH